MAGRRGLQLDDPRVEGAALVGPNEVSFARRVVPVIAHARLGGLLGGQRRRGRVALGLVPAAARTCPASIACAAQKKCC